MISLKELMEFSINERQCIAIVCFERYCKHHKIKHPEINKFIEHIWKISEINDNFFDWTNEFTNLSINGQGDPFPETLIEVIPEKIFNEFNVLCVNVYETSASCWFGAESDESGKMILNIFKVLNKYNIILPEIQIYRNSGKKDKDGWNYPICGEKIKIWRNSI